MDKKLLFNEALTSLVDFAAANANHVTMDDVKLYFKDLIDDDSQYQFIYDYLALNKVEVEGFTPPANNPLADDAPETSADETISETASVSNHVESEEELSFIKMYMEEMEALPNLSKDEEADLIDKLLAGDTSVSSKIVEANLSLVAKIAESHRGKGVNFGDLIQEGNVGLMLAVLITQNLLAIFIHLFQVELKMQLIILLMFRLTQTELGSILLTNLTDLTKLLRI